METGREREIDTSFVTCAKDLHKVACAHIQPHNLYKFVCMQMGSMVASGGCMSTHLSALVRVFACMHVRRSSYLELSAVFLPPTCVLERSPKLAAN